MQIRLNSKRQACPTGVSAPDLALSQGEHGAEGCQREHRIPVTLGEGSSPGNREKSKEGHDCDATDKYVLK